MSGSDDDIKLEGDLDAETDATGAKDDIAAQNEDDESGDSGTPDPQGSGLDSNDRAKSGPTPPA